MPYGGHLASLEGTRHSSFAYANGPGLLPHELPGSLHKGFSLSHTHTMARHVAGGWLWWPAWVIPKTGTPLVGSS